MAIYDFTGANGDPLPAGLTAQSGSFEIQSNRLAPTGAAPAFPHYLCTGVGLADSTISVVYNQGGGTGTNGPVVRYTDNSNFIYVAITLTGEVRLAKNVAGSVSLIGSATSIPSYNTSTDYVVSVEMSGTSIVVKVDGVTRNSATESFNSTANIHGLRAFETTVRYDDFNIPAAAVDSIAVAESPYSNKVYQVNSSDVAPVSFAVTYSGSPTSLQYRLLDASDDSTEVITWTTFDASPTGGTSTLSFNAPADTIRYHIEVRFSNDVGVTNLQATDWAAGENIAIMGQSLADDMSTDGAITPDDGYFVWNGSSNVVPTTGVGANEIANLIINGYGRACAIINESTGGSPLTFESAGDSDYWANSASTLFSTAVSEVNSATNGDNKLSFVFWMQGVKDSLDAVTTEQYLRMNQTGGLTSLFKNMRDNWTGPDDEALVIYQASLGRDTRVDSTTDSQHQAIRDAILTMCNADPHVHQINTYWMATEDGVHATDAAYIQVGQQIAQSEAFRRSDITVQAPSLVYVGINAGRDELTLYFDEDLNASDTSYSTEMLRVEEDGTPLTISSHARAGTRTTTVTLSSAIGASAAVRVIIGYGKGSTTTGLAYPRCADVTLPGTFGDVFSYCQAANALLEDVG
jgi:hypothetical protein